MNKRIQVIAKSVLGIAWAMGASGVDAATIPIDTFTSVSQFGTISGSTNNNPTNRLFQADAAVQGGEREILLQRTVGGGTVNTDVGITLTNGIIYATPPGTTLGSAKLIYDGNDDSVNTNFSLLNLDLTDNGSNDRFHIRGGADIAGGKFVLTVYASATGFSTYAISVPSNTFNTVDAALFTDFYVLFTDMTNFGGGADFQHARAITLELSGLETAQVDMGINYFAAIPETTTAWMLGALPVIALLRSRIFGRRT